MHVMWFENKMFRFSILSYEDEFESSKILVFVQVKMLAGCARFTGNHFVRSRACQKSQKIVFNSINYLFQVICQDFLIFTFCNVRVA